MEDNRLALDKSNMFRYLSSEDIDYSSVPDRTIVFRTAKEAEQERKNKRSDGRAV